MNIMNQNKVLDQVKALIAQDKLTQAEVSRQSSVSQQVLSPLLKGAYSGNSELYIEALSNWINTYESGKKALQQSFVEPSWVPTYTAKKLLNIMTISQALSVWTMAYEGAGVGKTVAARHYQQNNSNVWIITASPNLKARRAFLSAIARKMNITTNNMSIDRLDYEIMQKIEGSNGLLIIDEAQYVTDDALNGLRILTENRVGVTLLGNDIVRTRMSAPRSRVNMNPVWSRILKSHRIRNSTQKDIELYLKDWGITDSEVIQWAYKVIPTTTGQLRTLRNLIKLASGYAVSDNSAITMTHMDKAFGFIKEVA
ncbi:AAA family ATPase [Photobacterium damselae subsp. damselae]|uniref:AAA family ATPase n=1 Tax=Photobacterium damselae TaxID=38293 RepID=UPI001F445C2B|nr:AAA family ATPase [Photobacterium damselae]UJZ95017.1 AAA family ATPase [Photobacterium damselae subsp. damselae]UJZ98998.1 AAA family ATPase [Photobacterium damselae subsp. damselae]